MSLAQLRLHLGEQIRIIISDGRVIEGEFQVEILIFISFNAELNGKLTSGLFLRES